MCGIAGFLETQPGAGLDWTATLAAMGSAIAHRGPDDHGIWFDAHCGIGLVHQRLAIVDLTAAGHQPMASATGRYVLVYNGEIYNHMALRDSLREQAAEPAWRGHSDTETLLACIEAWGFEATLQAAIGMFAIALWDRQTKTLFLARDRMGEKPLYFGRQGSALLFGSELKALRRHPAFVGGVDRSALTLLLRHNYIPGPHSIYEGIQKLPAGHWVSLKSGHGSAQPQAYWSLETVALQGLSDPLPDDLQVCADALDRQLRDAVASQRMSDVPLGAFLSGGVDSSLVAAMMQVQSTQPVKTFTIGFHEAGYDEAPHARAVAQHLGTEHTELYVGPQDALDVVPRLPAMFDEPFADSSQIPTYLLAQMTRHHVTVALSGDGGDELFAGYSRYLWTRSLWNKMRPVPATARRFIARGVQRVPVRAWDAIASPLRVLLPRGMRDRSMGDRLHKAAGIFGHVDPHWLYRDLVSHWREPAQVVLQGHEPPVAMTMPERFPPLQPLERHMMYADSISYLPDDILVKVDRAAMACALETRVPLLDHRVVAMSWRLPMSVLLHRGRGKQVLRTVLDRYVPRNLIERPKQGFGIALDQWLRGPLRDWAEDLLEPRRLRNEGFFDTAIVQRTWQEHLSGQRNWQARLWTVLMFQAWLAEQLS
jgi:asparagine synthase (glutamine-hydrolysing)